MSKASAIKIGVSDFYVATATLGTQSTQGTQGTQGITITYGTPKVIGGTARVGTAMNRGENRVYESDQLIRNSNRISGATITYESRTVDMASEMEILHGIASATNDEYEDGPDNAPKNVAIGWAKHMSDGTYKCVWYYWCTGTKGDESDETATDSETSNTDSYEFAAMPAPDNGMLRRRAICADKTAMEAFFSSVRKSST